MCPFLYRDCDGLACPPASVSVALFSVLGLSSATLPLLMSVFALPLPPHTWPPPPSVVAFVVPPTSLWPPSPTSSTGYPPLCSQVQIQEHCQLELLSASLFCLS